MVTYQAIIRALKEASEADPGLQEGVGLYIDLLELESGVSVGPYASGLSESDVARYLQAGQPLLAAAPWTVDGRVLARLCVQIADITAQHRPDLATRLSVVSDYLAGRQEELAQAVSKYLSGGFGQQTASANLDVALCHFVLAHALHPFLRAEAEALMPLIDTRAWFRGTCPVCGGGPDMAALEASGARRLLCSRCDAEWPFYRVMCPFCSSDSIGYFAIWPGYRLYVCDSCRRYLKTVDLREMARERPLAAERILTADMDTAAQVAGWGAIAEAQNS